MLVRDAVHVGLVGCIFCSRIPNVSLDRDHNRSAFGDRPKGEQRKQGEEVDVVSHGEIPFGRSVDQGGEHARVGPLDSLEVGLVGPSWLLPAPKGGGQTADGAGRRLLGVLHGSPRLGTRERPDEKKRSHQHNVFIHHGPTLSDSR